MSSPDPLVNTSGRRSAREPPDPVEVDLPFDADGLHALRATVVAHASRLGAQDELTEHLLIVAGELASNAIRHGGGSGQLRLWHSDGVFYCQVRDNGPGFADPAVGTTRPEPTDGNAGRGVWICRNLTSDLLIEANPKGGGAIVTAAIPATGVIGQ